MTDDKINEIVEEVELIPQIITEEFFKAVNLKTQDVINELREKKFYEVAYELIRVLTIAENLQQNLKDEKAKVIELTDKQLDATGRVAEAIEISKRDNETIEKLRAEVTEAWKLSDASKTREVEVSERCEGTRKRFEVLQQEMKKISQKTVEDEGEFGEHKATVLEECKRLTAEVNDLNKRLQVQRLYSEEIQKKLDVADEKYRDLFTEWDEASNDSLRNKKTVEKQKIELDLLKENLEQVTVTLLHYKTQSETRHARLAERENQLNEMRDALDKSRNAFSELTAADAKLKKNLQSCTTQFNDMKHEMNQAVKFMNMKEDQNRKLASENESNLKKNETLMRKIGLIEVAASKSEMEILTLRNEIITVEKDRDSIFRSLETMKKENTNLSKKVESSLVEIKKREDTIADLKAEKTAVESQRKAFENDLKLSVERETKLKQTVKNIHAALETVESEKNALVETVKELRDDLNDKDKQIEKLKLEMNEAKVSLAHFKNEYNLADKRFKDASSDFQKCREKEFDTKDRFAKCKKQIEDTNEKLLSKIAESVTLMKNIQKFEKKVRELNRDIEGCRETVKETREELKKVRRDNAVLKETVRENDARFVTMKNQADKILRERDLIANQMLRKTDESELLEREVVKMQKTVERGNGMYNQRLEDMQMMKYEIKVLRSQGNVLKRAMDNTADMRHEVLKLHRQLNQERTKAKVLESEMVTPMNVHRWRKLSSLDPKRWMILKKYHRMQRSNFVQSMKIAKSEEINQALSEKIVMLEKELDRRPIAEVREKLMITRSQLQMSTKRMKAAIAISRASDTDIRCKDQKILQLENDIRDVKLQYHDEKRQKSKLKEKLRVMKKDDGNQELAEKLNNLMDGIRGSKLQ